MDKTGQMNLAEWIKGRELRDLVLPDGLDDDFIVIDKFPEIDYVLLYRNSKYEPWVAAFGYNEEKKSWVQGHYFHNLVNAVEHIKGKKNEGKGAYGDDLPAQIEYDYIKNHLWEDKRYELDKGYYVELSMNTDGINRVNIVLFNEDEEYELEWYVDEPSLISQNIWSLANEYDIFD